MKHVYLHPSTILTILDPTSSAAPTMGAVRRLLSAYAADGGDLRSFPIPTLLAIADTIDYEDTLDLGLIGMLLIQKKANHKRREPVTSIDEWLANFEVQCTSGADGSNDSQSEAEAYEQERERKDIEEEPEVENRKRQR